MNTKYLEIIKEPILTEKTDSLENKYTFKVDRRANKTEIKEAIQKIFNVRVLNVQTLNTKAKKKRVGRYQGYTKTYKKAIITVAPGTALEIK